MKKGKKRLIYVILINLSIAICISILTAKILPIIYVGAKLGVGLILSKFLKLAG